MTAARTERYDPTNPPEASGKGYSEGFDATAIAHTAPITIEDALAAWNESIAPVAAQTVGQALNSAGFMHHWAALRYRYADAMQDAEVGYEPFEVAAANDPAPPAVAVAVA